jgi:hypothetical protein
VECRRVRGILVGAPRDADLWDFCGAAVRHPTAHMTGASPDLAPIFGGRPAAKKLKSDRRRVISRQQFQQAPASLPRTGALLSAG